MTTVNYDLHGCLINCTKNGICLLNKATNLFKCECDEHYFGTACSFSKKLCDNTRCLNSGTCQDIILFNDDIYEYNYKCLCAENYYGDVCENMIDLCENVTCSLNGFCHLNGSLLPQCTCYQYFYGTNCEKENSYLYIVKVVIKTTSIIAIIIIIVFYSIGILIDLLNIFMPKAIKKRKNKLIVLKFRYYN